MASDIIVAAAHAPQSADELLRSDGDWRARVLQAVGGWPLTRLPGGDDSAYQLIGGDAMDWRQVALMVVRGGGASPQQERRVRSWLTSTDTHGGFSADEFKRYLGEERHAAHLNYFYGVTVERLALRAERDHLLKDAVSSGLAARPRAAQEAAYANLYGAGGAHLKRQFLSSAGAQSRSWGRVRATAEFTYWLFKLRVGRTEPAKLASDTKRALDLLEG